MLKKRIRIKKAEVVDITKHAGRVRTIKNIYDSAKFDRLSTDKKALIEKAMYQISKGKQADRSKKTGHRTRIENMFKKIYDVKLDKKTKTGKQSDHSVGGIKNRAGIQGIEQEVTSYSPIQNMTSYNAIYDFQTFAANYEFKIEPRLDEGGITAYFDMFVGDTDSGGTRRFMTAVGISETVTKEQFYEGLTKMYDKKKEQKYKGKEN